MSCSRPRCCPSGVSTSNTALHSDKEGPLQKCRGHGASRCPRGYRRKERWCKSICSRGSKTGNRVADGCRDKEGTRTNSKRGGQEGYCRRSRIAKEGKCGEGRRTQVISKRASWCSQGQVRKTIISFGYPTRSFTRHTANTDDQEVKGTHPQRAAHASDPHRSTPGLFPSHTYAGEFHRCYQSNLKSCSHDIRQ